MRVWVYALAAALSIVGAPAGAQTHAADVEARLARVVGDWTIAGQESSYRETCTWYGKRAFVVCNSSDSSDGSMSVSVLGYSKARERFTYHNYGSGGSSRSESGFPHGALGIVYTDERPEQGRSGASIHLARATGGRAVALPAGTVGQWRSVGEGRGFLLCEAVIAGSTTPVELRRW